MRIQTVQVYIVNGKVLFETTLPSEDTYVYALTIPTTSNSEGWYHFNPDELTVEQAKLELLNAILKNNRTNIKRLDDLQLPLIIALQELTQ